jgi:hypothetical protein
MALRTVICLGWMLTPACAGPFHELVLNGGCSWSGPAINWTAPEGYAVALTGTDVLTDFFTFDLTGYSGTATSGTLRPTRYWTGGPPLFSYTLSDVNAVLWGTGDTYGLATAENPGSPGEVLVIALNAEALADINASRGRFFSLAGKLEPAPAHNPEPGTGLLLGGGDAGAQIPAAPPWPGSLIGAR